MKKTFYLYALLITLNLHSQNNPIITGKPVIENVTIIKREKNKNFSSNKEKSESNSSHLNFENEVITNSIISTNDSDHSTGVTKGVLNISLTGAANYNIPISIPPGINGTVPEVVLSYNSQSRDGLAGWGWNINGISAITRIPSTKFHDNEIDAVDFDTSDRFSFDGQRLILKSGTYGGNSTEYETESFANLKITSHGVSPYGANYGPAYFLVQYPDGSKAYYGQTSNSLSRMDWAITYWENPFGIRISYEYILTGNNLNISKIKYGSVGSNTAINEIQFIYKSRQRQAQAYIADISFTRSMLLSEIKVIGAGTGYRNYILTHNTTSLGYQRISSITEKSGDNSKSLNPTTFTYSDTDENIVFDGNTADININTVRADNSMTVQGDFDGDGEMDFILFPTTGDNAYKKYWIFNNLTGNSYNIGYEHSLGKFDEIFPVSWLGGNETLGYKLMSQQGWVVVQTTTNNPVTFKTYSLGTVNPIYLQDSKEYNFPKYTYYNQSCDPSGGDPTQPSVPSDIKVEKVIPKKYINGDFDGDGISDIIAIERSFQYYYEAGCNTHISTYNGGRTFLVSLDRRLTNNFVVNTGYVICTNESKFMVADFNGDGKSDLFVFDNGICRIYTLSNNNTFTLITSLSSSNIALTKPIIMGDYNGDGKTDFIIPKANQSSLFVKYMSTGTNIIFSEVDLGIGRYVQTIYNNNNDSKVQHIIANDFNNDGATDLILTECRYVHSGVIDYVYQNRYISVRYFHNKGGQFESTMFATMTDIDGLNHFPVPIFVSFDKPNSNKQISFISNNKIYSAISKKDHILDTSLKEIKLGNGVKEIITYSSLISECNSNTAPNCELSYNSSAYIESYPNFDIKIAPSFKVVSRIEMQSFDTYKKQDYKYYSAVSNIEGLGFLGFKGIAKTDWYNNNSGAIITNINKHDISKRGVIVEAFSVLGNFSGNFTDYAPTDYISKTILNYESELLPNKVFKIKNTSSEVFNGLNGTSKATIITYDDYSNPLVNETKYKLGAEVQKSEKITFLYENLISQDLYIIGRPIQKNTESIYDSSTMTTEELYNYNTSHLLTQVKRKGTGTNYITENNIYDVFGNIVQKTLTAVGIAPRVTHYEYDQSGRFLIKSKDIEGLETSYTYNNSTGQLISETNPYGLTTSYFCDVWFRKRKVIDYLGNKKTYLFENIDNGRIKISSISDDGSQDFVVNDDLGREIIRGKTNINNQWNCIITGYDIHDREISKSEPYFAENPLHSYATQYSTTSYDYYGRLSQQVSSSGKITNISYNGLSATVNDGIKTTTTTKDAVENIIMMTDEGGTINYKYYTNNNLRESGYSGNIVSILQDGWGRKIQLKDPSAGNYSYTYNDFGELLSETTPKGKTTYTLGDTGKLIEKTIVGDLTNSKSTYIYDPSTKLLTSSRFEDLIDGYVTNYTYGYDDYKRLNFSDENKYIGYFQRATFFDAYGRPEVELYAATNTDGKSSVKWIQNTYKNGYHWQILDQETQAMLWQADTTNERGQLVDGFFGNGIKISNSYDQYGFATQAKHWAKETVLSPGRPIVVERDYMTLQYNFDPIRGNLNSRSNSLFNWNETFSYDSLDRLTHYTNAQGVQEEQSYDNKGRITENSVGTYNYSANKTYQNTSIEVNTQSEAYYANRLGIFNDGFENQQGWTTYWDPNYLSYDTFSHAGDRSIKLRSDSPAEKMIFSEINVPIDNAVATEYTYSAWVYSDGPQAEMFMYMRNEGETGYNVAFDGVQSNQTGLWKLVERTVLVPANIKSLSIRLDNKGGAGNVWYDNVHIRKTNNPVPSERQLNISYNAFKSPVSIEETGVAKIDFTYNDSNDRSAMYYGGLQNDKFQRQYRKNYSADGTMEIKYNIVTGETEFITYIEGNAYTAPLVLKSDGATQEYLYLHRDYQGSILAITDQNRTVVEKRLFDAWGNTVKIQDANGNNLSSFVVLDRGYTGHEHLQSVALIHMNGRLYDAKLHRFLQPDNFVQEPYNTQNYNRYAYVLNNPLKYTDFSGESFGGWWSKNWKSVVTITAAVVVGVVVTVATAGTATPFLVGVMAGAAGGFTGSALGTALNGGSVGDVLLNGLMGAGTGAIFGGAGAYVASFAPAGIINGALYGGSTNAALGGLGSLMSGGDWKQGAMLGGALGVLGGGYSGYVSAKTQGVSIWSGKPSSPKPSISEVIDESFKSAMKEYHAKLDQPAELPFKVQAEPTLFRGGNSLELSPADLRSGLEKSTGLMKEGFGLSLNTDKSNKFIDSYGGAFEVDLGSIPKSLKLVNTPPGGTHFVISPTYPISPAEFQNQLNKVILLHYNKIP